MDRINIIIDAISDPLEELWIAGAARTLTNGKIFDLLLSLLAIGEEEKVLNNLQNSTSLKTLIFDRIHVCSGQERET